MRKTIGLALLTLILTSPLATGKSHITCLPKGNTSACSEECVTWVQEIGGRYMNNNTGPGTDDKDKFCSCRCLYNL
jgi:hypothetical protein